MRSNPERPAPTAGAAGLDVNSLVCTFDGGPVENMNSSGPTSNLLAPARHFLVKTGSRSVLYLGLTLAAGFLQGFGLMLLIPLLHVIGIGDSGGRSSNAAQWIGHTFESLGLPLSLPFILVVFVVLMSIQSLFMFGQSVLGTSLVQGYTQAMQNDLFRGIAMAPLSVVSKRKASEFLHLTTHDMVQVAMGTQRVLNLIRDLLISTVFLLLSLAISIQLCLLALLCGLILLTLLRPLNRRSQATGTRLRMHTGKLTSDINDLLSGLKLIKAFGCEDRAIARFRESTESALSEHVGFVSARSLTQVFSQTGGAVTLALFVYMASEWLMIPASEYLVMILLFSRLLPRVSALQESWQFARHSRPAFEAVYSTVDDLAADAEAVPRASDEPLQLREGIEFSGVTFRYGAEGTPALEALDLRIPAGKITAVLGPSGAGKTTLADLLAGLVTPQRGAITIDDELLDTALVRRWRRSVGYVPQESFLFHESIRANLLWAKQDASEEELWEALRLARAERFVSRMPEGLDTIVQDRGGRLSGGERQRVALARALLIRPSLLLLDEATSEVDPRSQEQILETVSRLRGVMTIVMIAHHAPVEGIADRVVVLEQGRVVRG